METDNAGFEPVRGRRREAGTRVSSRRAAKENTGAGLRAVASRALTGRAPLLSTLQRRAVHDVAASKVRFDAPSVNVREADALFKTGYDTSAGPCRGCPVKSAPIDGMCWACATVGCLIKQ